MIMIRAIFGVYLMITRNMANLVWLYVVLGDMVIFHIVIWPSVRSPIHDIIVHGWVGARERLSVLVISYFIIIW